MKRYILFVLSLLALSANAQYIQYSKGLYGVARYSDNGKTNWLVKPKYYLIEKNEDGSFAVCSKDGKWGILSPSGKEVFPCQFRSKQIAYQEYEFKKDPSIRNYTFSNGQAAKSSDFTLSKDFTPLIRNYVEKKINEWQIKGEFEKTADFQRRVNEKTRNAMIEKLAKEVSDDCLLKVKDQSLRMTLGDYDADNESFLITTEIGDFVLKVPIKEAQEFKKNWALIKSNNTYELINGRVVLVASDFLLGKKCVASYNIKDRSLYSNAQISYNFDPISIPEQEDLAQFSPQITSKRIQVGLSDVDTDIPEVKVDNSHMLALIIANENYKDEVPVPFAHNDGEIIMNYFTHTLGIPEKNIVFLKDATKNEIYGKTRMLKDKASVMGEDVRLLVYYAGHGVPDDEARNAFIVPTDGDLKLPETLYNLSSFYSDLGAVKTSSTIVFLDACFSGHIRGDGMLMAARGIARKQPVNDVADTNMIIVTATKDNETALPYEEKGHGLFTYFLLKKLKSTRGNVSMGELTDYLIEEVKKYSVLENSKRQTPSVIHAPSMENKWRDIMLY